MNKNLTHRLLELDALRGIAALSVIFFHITINKAHGIYYTLFSLGITGVELFFMISGFVILMTLEKIKNANSFIIGRITRLYPTYWTCVTITAALLIVKAEAGALNIQFLTMYAANMTMFQNYFFQKDIDGSYWTLLIEMTFYIVMLIIYKTGNLKKIDIIGGIALIPLFIYGFYVSHLIPATNEIVVRFCGLLIFFPLFFAGILYYNLKFEAKHSYRYVLLAMCFVTQLTLYHIIDYRIRIVNIRMYAAMLIIYNGIFLLYTFDLLKFIVNKVFVFFGEISYPLYLIHQFVSLNIILPFLLKYTNLVIAGAIDIAIVTVTAYLINRYIEKPSYAYLKRKWAEKPKEVGAPAGQRYLIN